MNATDYTFEPEPPNGISPKRIGEEQYKRL
jgi:hypothetical protein